MNKTGWQITATIAIFGVIALALFIVFRSEQATAPVSTTPSVTPTPPIDDDASDGSSDADPTSTQTEWPSASGNIVVTSPLPNTLLCGSVRATGRARVFEATFNMRLVDAAGNILVEDYAMANAPDMGFFGDFDETLLFTPPSTMTGGTLMIFDYSARDGSIIDLVEIPVQLSPARSC